MSRHVYANGMAIAGKAGDNKSIARFPDVCMSPPPPPTGPLPVPYADTSLSGDLKEGTDSVKISGQPAALSQQSYYQPSALGDEAATKAWGMNVVTHQITGKTYFQAWSMDVKFEGKNVCRHLDITTSNHASAGGTTVPAPTGEDQTVPPDDDESLCPCCKKPLHENQKDADGQRYPKIKEDDFYDKGDATMKAKVASIATDVERGAAYTRLPSFPDVKTKIEQQLAAATAARATVANARSIVPPCENLHSPKDEGCGMHLDVQRPLSALVPADKLPGMTHGQVKTHVRESVLEFNNSVKTLCRSTWREKLREKGRTIGKKSPVNHMTPLAAGGCPTSQKNLIPSDALPKECQAVDAAQTKLQEIGFKDWTA